VTEENARRGWFLAFSLKCQLISEIRSGCNLPLRRSPSLLDYSYYFRAAGGWIRPLKLFYYREGAIEIAVL
jgi:hypothetical protein